MCTIPIGEACACCVVVHGQANNLLPSSDTDALLKTNVIPLKRLEKEIGRIMRVASLIYTLLSFVADVFEALRNREVGVATNAPHHCIWRRKINHVCVWVKAFFDALPTTAACLPVTLRAVCTSCMVVLLVTACVFGFHFYPTGRACNIVAREVAFVRLQAVFFLRLGFQGVHAGAPDL